MARRGWPTLGTHGVQRHAAPPEYSKGVARARRPIQRQHFDDRTNYYETEPADDDNLEFALDLEADRLVNSNIKKEELDSEMTVVRNEFERGENSPSVSS